MNRPDPPLDRLQALLQRFTVSARMFHSGPLCGLHDFGDNGLGQLHLLKRGPIEVRHAGEHLVVEEPSLLFYPRPLPHRFVSDPDTGADLACANLAFGPGRDNPLARALPHFLRLPLAELSSARAVLELLFEEAFTQRCGRQAVVDRLFEVVLVLLLRYLLDSGRLQGGPLAGLGHPMLAKALVAMHERPAGPWTLDSLARVAGMSRSRFAEVFAQVVGQPPARYLTGFRIALAQDALRRGEPLERIAEQVGYGSSAALSRAFSAECGLSPRQWRRQAS
ncbi:AraC family transcriptional regulator [Arenimonas fontis]|jgi:AraC-like DNA-binding protein|uniref:AraC family transcriptional regulator n=1 Tax=Arenimonas fontis TaxID=2608255 RepID=A0A5B2ZDH7_9GAMM|nr:AraC family transcriptional regulator [Arenimonas fontis]KAA2285081.1 AraC family transcriptional regulator [Arenimonas fontis]